eukprot:TRINITY_DN872_c0_g1_i4.p2 TRINITY_DN872_c0_g1~~TRINITY_DN872_c0_g1_i4.p2  ORF type:complete len:102 (-),score=18.58 TRINITY_DN872_c0_g1_i4:102-407(-)
MCIRDRYQSVILATPFINYGKGVCGTCWATKQVQIVNDISTCDNYIACDEETKSEVVIPVFYDSTATSEVRAVFDVDSIHKDRFDEIDEKYIQELVNFLYD